MSWLRHPRTTKERREWFGAAELAKEYPKLKLRRRRSSNHLPNAYDDIPKSNGDDRSWKKHRAVQWDVRRASGRKARGNRGTFDTPIVEMHKSPFWCWGWRTKARDGMHQYRVRLKYIKNKTA